MKPTKSSKKLHLGRETLRTLDRGGLQHAAGARLCTFIPSTCDPNTALSCNATICNCQVGSTGC